MKIFIRQDDASPELSIRRALSALIEAGIYSAEGGGTVNDRPLIVIDEAHVPEAIAALNKAGMRPLIG